MVGGGGYLLNLQIASVAILHISTSSMPCLMSYVAPILAVSVQALYTSAFMLAYFLYLCLALVPGFWRYVYWLLWCFSFFPIRTIILVSWLFLSELTSFPVLDSDCNHDKVCQWFFLLYVFRLVVNIAMIFLMLSFPCVSY